MQFGWISGIFAQRGGSKCPKCANLGPNAARKSVMAPALEITPIGNHRSAKAHPKKFERAFEPAVFCSPGQTGLFKRKLQGDRELYGIFGA